MSAEIVLYRFRWWYKGKTVDGNVVNFSGHVHAVDAAAACNTVEHQMREKHPDIRWMLGKRIETISVLFGPTVQQLKRGQRRVKE